MKLRSLADRRIVFGAAALLMIIGILLLVAAVHPKKITVKPTQPNVAIGVVEITGSGFVPSTIQVSPGSKVVWVNKDSAPHQVAADPYPTHASLPALFAPKPLGQGQTYSFVFTKPRTITYHDELNPTWEGTVEVR